MQSRRFDRESPKLDRREDTALIRTRMDAKMKNFFLVLITFGLCVLTYGTISSFVNSGSKLGGSGAKSLRTSLFQGEHSGKVLDPLVRMPDHLRFSQGPREKRPFHVVVTSDDSPYSRWQCRVMYYWYQQFKDHPESEMGGFTRLFHSYKPDNLMDEIPTFIVDPLPPGEDRGYVVLNRPWAFVQWLEQATIEEEYILMAEPDHIFRRPLPNLAAIVGMPVAFPFFYILPEKNEELLRKFFPIEKGPITNIDPIGNSPVIIKQLDLKKIVPTWFNTSIAMKTDPQADEKFGWVLEMYGYAVASALHGVQHMLQKRFMLQPPFDSELEDKYIIHYTYALDYTLKGEMTWGQIGEWRFDKRSFFLGAPPRNLPLPPPGFPESVVALITAINEATANIPNWVAGA